VVGLVDAECLEAASGTVCGDHVRLQIRVPEQLDLAWPEQRIVDIGDDRPREVRDLLVVGGEHRRVAPVREREESRVAHSRAPGEGAELDPPLDPLAGSRRQISVEPPQAREQLCVAWVVVSREPDAREEDPVGVRLWAGHEPAKGALLHQARLCR
jgi:hypothetical protein